MIRPFVITLLTTTSIAATPSFAADLPRDAAASFGCLPRGAVTSLLPAEGYSEVKRLGEDKGVTFFDAKKGGSWFRVAVNSCTAAVEMRTRQKAPA